ncbi:MAG: phosphoribosylamine--glycine ligase [Nitrosomonadaceae bacterium]|jgi:phosphoribosylamine--glycine ligase|nr:phosphoribosylamine--glycine ligase [Nitrosomonadaceae bacterium]
MKVLVIGGGGREHALAWRLKQSPRVNKVFVAPGNAGTAFEEGLKNIPMTAISDLINFVKNELVEITIVGPEAPLAEGIVDAFRLAGLKIFGPTKQAIQLESSKDYSKSFMLRHGIPTAAYAAFCDPVRAHKYLDKIGAPIVIKADGLAAGKGVKVAMTLSEAHEAVDAMLVSNSMGGAGEKILIEEFLEGEEVSFIVMADGKNVLPLATSQDYKRLGEGNQGPNTGGMGAYSPASIVTPELHERIITEVIDPVIKGMAEEGQPYTGFLYAGLMIGKGGSINVLEYNCRMGDPETQSIMLRLKSDLSVLVENAIDGTLNNVDAEWDCRAALGVVIATCGYPEMPRKGDVIHGLSEFIFKDDLGKDFHVFQAGTKMGGKDGKEIVTAGGRVLCVAALGNDVKNARYRAYEIANQIYFDGCQMRADIGL